jgi:hypothetical protein
VDNIAQFIVQTRFVCQFNIEGRVTSVNAQLLSDTIYCDEMDFTYTSRAPNITATFAGKLPPPPQHPLFLSPAGGSFKGFVTPQNV